MAQTSAFDLTFQSLSGAPMPLSDYRDRALLVVNTASACGFTPQLAGLQQLWQDYGARGLVVIGVPSNDFAGQEPLEGAAIGSFCSARFAVDFPLTAKTHVRGPEAHPLFQMAGERFGPFGRPRWNFHKLLIGRDGQLRDWFTALTPPKAGRLRRAVEAALAA